MLQDAHRLRSDQIISIVAIALVLILLGALEGNPDKARALLPTRKTVYTTVVQPIPVYLNLLTNPVATSSALYPEFAPEFNPETISASAAAVIDLGSHAVLYEKDSGRQLLPASTTKLMTAIVARELYDLDEVITITELLKIDGAAVKFYLNEQLTVSSLLEALLVQSGNDAAVVLARHHPDGEAGFIAAMNKKAADLNMNDTNFKNVTGFDHPDHYSTALDLALLSQEAMMDEVIRVVVGQPTSVITDLTGTYRHYLYSTNILLRRDQTVVGIKTGTTEGAGEVLITQVERDGRAILIVVLGSSDRYDDTLQLIEWAYSRHEWRPFEQTLFADPD